MGLDTTAPEDIVIHYATKMLEDRCLRVESHRDAWQNHD